MEDRRERNGRMSVPQFGSWENQGGPNPADGYTMVFTKARADRKEQKAKPVPTHLANSSDNNTPPTKPHNHHHHHRRHHHHHQGHGNHHHRHQSQERHSHKLSDEDAMRKKNNMLTYLNCCIRP